MEDSLNIVKQGVINGANLFAALSQAPARFGLTSEEAFAIASALDRRMIVTKKDTSGTFAKEVRF